MTRCVAEQVVIEHGSGTPDPRSIGGARDTRPKAGWFRRPALAAALCGMAFPTILIAPASAAAADQGAVVVQMRNFVTHFKAYARVEPIMVLKLRAATTGVVSGLAVAPGTQVDAGTVLAHLSGPVTRALLADREAGLASAQAASTAAKETLRIERQNRGLHLSTDQAVFQAEAKVEQAKAHLDDAHSQLAALRGELDVVSPKAGHVLTVDAADGERVTEGQVLLILQPDHQLWLKVALYGATAAEVQPGMHGEYHPAAGGAAIPIAVHSVVGALAADGSRVALCLPSSPNPGWRSGESGTVIIDGPAGALPAVPTRSLVLDQGRWWVMVHTDGGDRRQPVVPGPAEGDLTLIRSGVAAGMQVIMDNPYLRFHQDFSQTYQQPD